MPDIKPVDAAYELALDYVYGLINFELTRHDRYMASKLDPRRPQRLMALLGSPHEQYPSIHIAGTKGKGSVAAMCAASLRAMGLKVGLYTSPHVRDFRERIRVLTPADADGRIPKERFVPLVERLKPVVGEVSGTTWFEVVTAIAFLHFAQEEIDVAVVEVGLGGRLDATNVLTPLVSVITSLSYDHTEFLGNTLAEIATEKAGIIKPGVPVVTASQPDEALDRIKSIAGQRQAPLLIVGQEWQYARQDQPDPDGKRELTISVSADPDFLPPGTSFRLALSGAHQLENATVALAALSVARSAFPDMTLQNISKGLATVHWTGRLEIVHQSPGTATLLTDCAHNVDSASKLRYALTHDYDYQRLWLVLGATRGKDVRGILAELLPLAEAAIATIADHPRAIDPAELVELARELGFEMIPSHDVSEGLLKAWELAGPGDLICVTGSIFVVGDLLNHWETLKSRLLSKTAIP